MRVFIEGVGVVGPGLNGWAASRPALAGTQPYAAAPTAVAASPLLPAAERRRAGMPIKLALAAGAEAIENARRDAAAIATVLASSSGDCDNLHAICETLATPERQVSPTRFHNSVHNSAAGYWSIATQCREPSTSLACRDWSFAAGLLDAASQVAVDARPVALIAYDHPYPSPLAAVRPVAAAFGVALVLSPQGSERALATLDIELEAEESASSYMQDPGLEALRAGVPAARCLPILAALARRSRASVALEYLANSHLRVGVAPCA